MILYRNLREITIRLTNVIPERIIFVSRGITVLGNNNKMHLKKQSFNIWTGFYWHYCISICEVVINFRCPYIKETVLQPDRVWICQDKSFIIKSASLKTPFIISEMIGGGWDETETNFNVDKKNQLDVTFCILYFSSNSCLTCFGQPCAHHQELTTAWCYSLVLVCAVAAGRLSRPVGR